MQPPIRIVLLLFLVLASSGVTAAGQQASGSPAKPSSVPTPIPLIKVPLEAQSAVAALQEIEADVSRDQSSADENGHTLLEVTNEIDSRIDDDTKVLNSSPSLDVLYRLKLSWRNFGLRLSVLEVELTRYATSVAEQLARVDQLNRNWQATLQSAKQPQIPPTVLQSVQNVVDSIERTRQAAESGQDHVLTLQSKLSTEQARVRRALSSIGQAENRALQNIFVRNSQPVWSLETSVGTEWLRHSDESFSSQLKTSIVFSKRLPFTFLFHALFVVLVAAVLHWMRRRIQRLAKEKPDLQHALPILDLPVSTALALSMLVIPVIYAQAPRLILAIMGAVTLIPAAIILRRLLDRHSYPILNAIVIMYFAGQLRVLVASLPVLARFIFFGQLLGAIVFLVWVLRSWRPPPETAQTRSRVWRTIRAVAKIGLVILPAAFLADVFGYVNLGNLLGIIFLRSTYIAAMLYTAIRILEGLLIIALEVRPLGSLRVVSLHREMILRRSCRALELLALLFWLYILLNFFGLLTPVIMTTEAALNANLAFGSFNITPSHILAFAVAVWASFLVSKFLRFVLEEDVYHHLKLARGIPYAISTILHYLVLLLGFFIALGALGIDLTKVTLLAGAFTVGIGFGLQNVINNFVSGLILLFERPIKVGDVIEAGGNVGEVSRIGIRASIIRTADGSEVIVPNGSLISSQVTNWTFSDRQRAIEISVNVAGGADPQRVVELLKRTAAAQSGVSQEPLPQVYVTNFTAGSVTFQLRAWTDRHEDWTQLRSDLAVAANEALAREKIAIA
jgi:potassium-dependent mechanosensitive channel